MIKKFLILISFTILILILILILSCIGCNSTKDQSKDISHPIISMPTSIYTGEEISEEDYLSLPFMTMIENSSASRPQSGLSQADIIYETSAEGGIPRFIALFQSNSPDKIGPIRSVRPYFIEIAEELNLPLAHCGGSEEALNNLTKKNSITSINEIIQGDYFWRDNSKKAPHNLYTSSSKLRDFISSKSILNVDWKNKRNFIEFDRNYFLSSNWKVTNKCKITINKYYNTSYTYDGVYTKSMDDEESIDELTNSPLTFSNIIIQKTNIKLNPDGVHLDINLNGEGDGYLLSQGKLLDITWVKTSNQTKLKDLNGAEVKLTPGKTIWHIVDKKTQINF